MSKTFETLTKIAAWVLFVTFLTSMLAPIFIGLATGALAGNINTVDDGKLWFYRHGLSFLIGVAAFFGYYYAVKLLKE